MGYQGTYSRTDLPWMGMDLSALHDFHMLKDGFMNFLKTGIENNDMITTVSPSYAREIRTLSYGEGLDQSLNHRKESLRGILNGVDYSSWNPESDPLIAPDNYGFFDLSGKKACKKRLQIRMGLPEDEETPLFAMITRLVSQKGIEELCRPGYGILEDFCRDRQVQVVILGTGEPWCEQELTRLSGEMPDLAVKITYNEELSHLIEAGADFFMMPSRYEPCGLNQLYSLKYGTLPIVRRTGGLADSVRDPRDEGENRATGFVFDNPDPVSFRGALNRAVDCWEDNRDLIRHMRIRGMREDFSWTESARSYAAVYEEALEEKANRLTVPEAPPSSPDYDENLFMD
jgi:starch synthase